MPLPSPTFSNLTVTDHESFEPKVREHVKQGDFFLVRFDRAGDGNPISPVDAALHEVSAPDVGWVFFIMISFQEEARPIHNAREPYHRTPRSPSGSRAGVDCCEAELRERQPGCIWREVHWIMGDSWCNSS